MSPKSVSPRPLSLRNRIVDRQGTSAPLTTEQPPKRSREPSPSRSPSSPKRGRSSKHCLIEDEGSSSSSSESERTKNLYQEASEVKHSNEKTRRNKSHKKINLGPKRSNAKLLPGNSMVVRRYNNILFYLVNYINPDVIEADMENFDVDVAVMPMSSQWQVNGADDLLPMTHELEAMSGIKNTESKNNTLAVNTRKQYYIALEKYRKWCEREYQHELRRKYEVSPNKVLRFFSDVIITQTVPKYSNRNKSYIGALPANSDDMVPASTEVLEQAKNAIIYLSLEQASRPHDANLNGILPKDLFKNMMESHVRNVQYKGSGVPSKNSGLGDPISDSYTVYEHLLALKATWIQKEAAYSPYIREHFCLAVRHSMLLIDEDLRRLNLSNMFSYQLPRGPNETQQVSMLVFSMRESKTNQNYRQEYGCAIRHYDVRRCSVGALGFYLLERFHKRGEVIDFDDYMWQSIKLVTPYSASEDSSTTEIQPAATHEVTTNVFDSVGIETSHVTHSGRHSGSIEAQRIGVPEEEIHRAGRWIQDTSKMHQYHLSNLSIPFARGIAGFKEKPFHLRRNEVVPSESLQRKIFPFIETAYSAKSEEEQALWLQTCHDEMNEISKDDGSDEEDDERLENLDVVISKKNKRKKEGGEIDPAVGSDFAKRMFLKLLLRLRRVVLQDAAALMHKGWLGPALSDPVFQSVEFEKFRKQVVEALERRDTTLPDNISLSVVNELRAMLRQKDIMLGMLKDLTMMSSNATGRLEQLYGREETPSLPSQLGSFYVNRSHDQGQYNRVSKPATATSSSNPLQIQTFRVPHFVKHHDTSILVGQIWEMYQSYLVHIAQYRKDSIEDRLRKRVTSGGRILSWFLILAKDIMEERPNLPLMHAIRESIEAFQVAEAKMVWSFDGLYKACRERLQEWERENPGVDAKKECKLDEFVKDNNFDLE